jgi:hypothetical protein
LLAFIAVELLRGLSIWIKPLLVFAAASSGDSEFSFGELTGLFLTLVPVNL